MEGGAAAVNGFNHFVLCGGFALGGVTVVCVEDDVGMLVNCCIIEVELSEAADVSGDGVKQMTFEGAQAGWVIRTQDRSC